MKDRDQELLWERYISEKKDKHDDKDHDDKKKGKYDDGDGKTERCDFVPCDEEVAEEAKSDSEDKTPYDGHNEDEDEVNEERVELGLPEDDVFKATEMAEGGDWRSAIETTMSALANHMIDDITQSGNGPLDEVETADVWNIKDGIKLAVEDLLSGQNAQMYETLTKNLRNAFHKSDSAQKELSQFFDGEPPLER